MREFQELRADVRVAVHHADARALDWGETFDALVTSPPYPGRIDYHEQHRYAFELLGLEPWTSAEIGAPAQGLSTRGGRGLQRRHGGGARRAPASTCGRARRS